MATYTNTFAFDMSVSANFQALMNQIHTEILAFGWVDPGDTGQVDLTAAASPGLSTFAGYRIYKTGDALTAIYMKVQYGEGVATTVPALRFTFGTGTDGAGTPTGSVSAAIDVAYGSSNAGTHRLYMSGDTNRLMVYIGDSNASSSSTAVGISIHRIVDGSGAAITGGIDIFTVTNNSTTQRFHPTSGTLPNVETSWCIPYPNRAVNVLDTVTMTGHALTWQATGAHNPSPAVAVGGITDFTVGTPGNTTTISLYSSSRTFLITNQFQPISNYSNIRALVLYD